MTLQFLFSVRLIVFRGAVALFVSVIMSYGHLLELVVNGLPPSNASLVGG